MKYFHLFETQAAHDAVYNGNGYREPWVALTESTDLITYNKITDYRDIVGSIAYFDGSEVKFISKDAWASRLGTPIGVVVIPASHMQDGKCRVMSLCNMSYLTPDTGTLGVGNDNYRTYGFNLKWGVMGTDTSLTNYTKVQSKGAGIIDIGYFPSDFIKGKTSIDINGNTYSVTTLDNLVDTKTAWWTEIGENRATSLAVSPYLANGSQNPAYLTAGQVLSDMDGKSNTNVLVNLSAIKDTYTSGAFENVHTNNYPAAFACHLFNTQGTSQGDWYLPSMGELGYLYARHKLINEALVALGPSNAVKFGDLTDYNSFGYWLWSSSEYNSNYSWYVYSNGRVDNNSLKADSDPRIRVRSFIAL